VTPQIPAPLKGGEGSPDTGVKQVGAFTLPTSTGPATPSAPAPKPKTEHVSLRLGSGDTRQASKPVPIPNVPWTPPVVAVQAKQPGGQKMVVTYVGDGDGASARGKDGSSINCRIDSIDAPETAKPKYGKEGQRFSEESRRSLEQMILNKEVTVRVSRPAVEGKNHSRALCQIEIEGQNVDKEMIRNGMAWLYRRYNNNAELSALEIEARKEKRGLWVDPNPVNPETFRRMQEYGTGRLRY